jgi:hypothetical protein
MAQRTETLNSSITILKKLPINNNQLSPRSFKKSSQHPVLSLPRETTSIKLPALVKRSPTTSKTSLEKKLTNSTFLF